MAELELSWLDASEHSAQTRLFIWRVPTSESLLDGFIALQQHPEGRTLPDLFLGLTTPFETGFGYSEALGREFVEHYEATPDAADWQAEPYLPCYSPCAVAPVATRVRRPVCRGSALRCWCSNRPPSAMTAH